MVALLFLVEHYTYYFFAFPFAFAFVFLLHQ